MVTYIHKKHNLSTRQACRAIGLNRSFYYYKPIKKADDEKLVDILNRLSSLHPRNGFKKLYLRIRNLGYKYNHKKVYRLYKKLGLNIRRNTKKRLPARVKTPLSELFKINSVWAMDFISDTLWSGRRYRALNIIDEFNREFLDVVIDTSSIYKSHTSP